MKLKFLFATLLLAAWGCEILEEDISKERVRIVAPADRITVTAGEVDFRWQGVAYATGYELTVVTPSFTAAERIVIDTVIRADSLDRRFGCRLTLDQGEYEWSVMGFNGGYTTHTEVRSLTVVAAEVPDSPETPGP